MIIIFVFVFVLFVCFFLGGGCPKHLWWICFIFYFGFYPGNLTFMYVPKKLGRKKIEVSVILLRCVEKGNSYQQLKLNHIKNILKYPLLLNIKIEQQTNWKNISQYFNVKCKTCHGHYWMYSLDKIITARFKNHEVTTWNFPYTWLLLLNKSTHSCVLCVVNLHLRETHLLGLKRQTNLFAFIR